MPSMPWVKLWTEILDDPKMAELSSADKWLFVQLILLAGECDLDGAIPLTMKQIAWRLRVDLSELTTGAGELESAGLISIAADSVTVRSFDKRQDRPQSVKQQQWAEAQRRHRDKSSSVIHDTSMTNTEVIPLEEEEEGEAEGDAEGEAAAAAAAAPMAIGPVYDKFTQEIGILTPRSADMVGGWIDDYGEEWVISAIDKAVMANARKPAYVDAVLQGWKTNGRGARASPRASPKAGKLKNQDTVDRLLARKERGNGKKPDD